MTRTSKKKAPAPKGKNVESLENSQQIRSKFLAEYGGIVPQSILVHDKSDKALDLVVETERSYTNMNKTAKKIENRTMRKAFQQSGQTCRGKSGGLSRFPQNIGRNLAKFHTKKGDTYYDPFAGHNSRMELAHSLELNYIGVDVSEKFMDANEKIRDVLLQRDAHGFIKNEATIKLIRGSSAKVPLKSNSADFTLTSPPYWDLEYYGDEPEQLGKNKTYASFMKSITKHVEENFRILKPGSFCIWCVNDFTKDGVFYPYHDDLMMVFKEVGFKAHAIYILDLGTSIGACFVQSIIQQMRFPKRHEYALVFKKPLE